MLRPNLNLLVVVTTYVSVANGQQRWLSNQVNTTLCQWRQLRGEFPRDQVLCLAVLLILGAAHVVRDTLYLDGGSRWWLPGLDDGSYGAVSNDSKLQAPTQVIPRYF